MDDAPKRLLTIAEAAVEFNVCLRTIHNWLKRGRLSYAPTAGRTVRIIADSFEEQPAPAPVHKGPKTFESVYEQEKRDEERQRAHARRVTSSQKEKPP